MTDEEREELRQAALEMMTDAGPMARALAFAACFTNETAELIAGEHANPHAALAMVLMTLLHAADRHPEWLKAVVADSQWLIEPGGGDEAEQLREDALMDICRMYPLPVMQS